MIFWDTRLNLILAKIGYWRKLTLFRFRWSNLCIMLDLHWTICWEQYLNIYYIAYLRNYSILVCCSRKSNLFTIVNTPSDESNLTNFSSSTKLTTERNVVRIWKKNALQFLVSRVMLLVVRIWCINNSLTHLLTFYEASIWRWSPMHLVCYQSYLPLVQDRMMYIENTKRASV